MDPTYHYKKDCSLRDSEITTRHVHYDAVLGGEALVTFLKDEGACNSFISDYLVAMLGWEDQVINIEGSETSNFVGMGGGNIDIKGKMRHVPI